jgi:hypothetical protein
MKYDDGCDEGNKDHKQWNDTREQKAGDGKRRNNESIARIKTK